MTPEQAKELARVTIKAESLQDNFADQGFKGLKIGGFFDPSYIYNQRQNRAGFQFLNRVNDDGYNYDNSYFGSATIDFQKEMEGGTRWRRAHTMAASNHSSAKSRAPPWPLLPSSA